MPWSGRPPAGAPTSLVAVRCRPGPGMLAANLAALIRPEANRAWDGAPSSGSDRRQGNRREADLRGTRVRRQPDVPGVYLAQRPRRHTSPGGTASAATEGSTVPVAGAGRTAGGPRGTAWLRRNTRTLTLGARVSLRVRSRPPGAASTSGRPAVRLGASLAVHGDRGRRLPAMDWPDHAVQGVRC
jgi:hypothetical protein